MDKENHMRKISTLIFAALMLLTVVLPAVADEEDKATKITIDEPVEVPGHVLEPGTYTFRLLAPETDQQMVEIRDSNQKLVTLLLGMPASRRGVSDNNLLHFKKNADGGPEEVQAWFFPGETEGVQFAYPKVKAKSLAKANQRTVPFVPDSTYEQAAAQGDSTQAAAIFRSMPVKGVTPSGNEVELAATARMVQ
jgi:hypothetical protein